MKFTNAICSVNRPTNIFILKHFTASKGSYNYILLIIIY